MSEGSDWHRTRQKLGSAPSRPDKEAIASGRQRRAAAAPREVRRPAREARRINPVLHDESREARPRPRLPRPPRKGTFEGRRTGRVKHGDSSGGSSRARRPAPSPDHLRVPLDRLSRAVDPRAVDETGRARASLRRLWSPTPMGFARPGDRARGERRRERPIRRSREGPRRRYRWLPAPALLELAFTL